MDLASPSSPTSAQTRLSPDRVGGVSRRRTSSDGASTEPGGRAKVPRASTGFRLGSGSVPSSTRIRSVLTKSSQSSIGVSPLPGPAPRPTRLSQALRGAIAGVGDGLSAHGGAWDGTAPSSVAHSLDSHHRDLSWSAPPIGKRPIPFAMPGSSAIAPRTASMGLVSNWIRPMLGTSNSRSPETTSRRL